MMPNNLATSLRLFEDAADAETARVILAQGAMLLRGFALPFMPSLLQALEVIIAAAPLRHMLTPRGFRMSVAITNCGAAGWVTDLSGYRYEAIDPLSGERWPGMPACFAALAAEAAAQAGFSGF